MLASEMIAKIQNDPTLTHDQAANEIREINRTIAKTTAALWVAMGPNRQKYVDSYGNPNFIRLAKQGTSDKEAAYDAWVDGLNISYSEDGYTSSTPAEVLRSLYSNTDIEMSWKGIPGGIVDGMGKEEGHEFLRNAVGS